MEKWEKKIFRAQHLVNNNIGLVIRMSLYRSHKIIKAELDRKKIVFVVSTPKYMKETCSGKKCMDFGDM